MGLLSDIVAEVKRPEQLEQPLLPYKDVDLLDIAQQIEPYIPQRQKKGFFEANKDGWRLGGLNLARAFGSMLDYVGPPEEMRDQINIESGMSWTLRGETFAAKIEELIEDHPEWQNPQAKNVWDLITSPTKLSSSIAQSLPMMIGAGLATAGGQPQIALAIVYEVEGQGAYDEAIREGATEEQAQLTKSIYGSVAAVIEFAQINQFLKIGGIGKKMLMKVGVKKATEAVKKEGMGALTKRALMLMLHEGTEEIAQGTWQEATAKMIYGKDILDEKGIWGFLDRRAQEFVTAGAMSLLGVGGGAAVNISDRIEAKLEGRAYARDIKIQSQQKFKEFALTPTGAEFVAAMSPQVAARIAGKEKPSRNDFKEMGMSGWSAAERAKLAGLFRDALSDQERMAQNERAIEQLQEAVSWQEREVEKAQKAKEREKVAPADAEELETPSGEEFEPKYEREKPELDIEAMDQDELDMAEEITADDPDQVEFHEQLVAEQKRRRLAAGETVVTGGKEKQQPAAKPAEKVTPGKRFYTIVYGEEGETTFTEVKGKLVKLDEFPDLDLFVHKSGSQWAVSEGRTGRRITDPQRTQKLAIASALAILTRNKDQIEKVMQEALETSGLSPRYTEKEEAPAKEKPKKKGLKEKPTPEGERILKSIQLVQLMNNVTALLQREEGAIDNRKVDEMAREVFGAAAGKARAAYDAFEAGMNKYIETNLKIDMETGFDALQQLEQQMPRQTRRDDTQVEFQQFSTPPTEAYVVVRAAGIQAGMSVLEPSAGTGNIAILAKEFGGEVEANEIDDRRRALLEALGFKTLNINAEQLDNILDPSKKYDVVVMNPPFSATGGRVAKHDTKVGARHVEQALLRLKKGGRLVAIVGEGMALDRENFREWWAKIEKKYDVRANIGMSGKYYGKFGTTFGNQIVIIDNTGATESEDQIVTGAGLSPTEALALLDSISRENIYERIKRAGGAAAVQRKRKPGSAATGGAVGPGVGKVPRDRGPGKGATKIGKKRAPGKAEEPTGTKGVGGGVGGVGTGDVTNLTPQEQKELEDTEKALRKELSGEKDVSYGVYPEEPVKKGRKGKGLNPKVLMLGIKHGALRAKSGVTSYADWSKLMTDAFGVRINPYLKKIYKSIRSKYPQYNLQSDQVIKEAGPDDTVQVEKETVAEGAEVKELEGGVFSEYRIQKATVKGAAKHPANIVESTVLASAEPPDVKVKHYLPSEVITEGRVSDIQMEAVVYAQQAHETVMANGERAGIWIGDGTGLGKGREIYAVIYNNYMQGRRKAVHISLTHQLKEDAQRDSDDVGQPLKFIHQKPSMKDTAVIEADEGVLFTTYTMASRDWKHSRKRYKQIIDWLGPDFDGVIAFDESHKMKNAAVSERGGKLSTKGGTDVGDMGIDLQRRYPNARIMYVSATGGSEARHLVPYERLGLWGKRLPFNDFYEFAAAIQAGGIKAMETLARDLKLVGRFIARTISYEGVDFSQPVKYQLTDAERDQFDRMADFWAVLNQAFDEANKNSNAPPKFTTYFATQQQFFLQLMMGYELPTVIKEIEKDLAEGRSSIVSIVHTGEAISQRIISDALKEGIQLAEIELSPRQMLVDLVQRHFPLEQYEERTDPRSKKVIRVPVLDEAGNPVLNRENIRIQEDLLSQIADFTLPTNPLDSLMEHFGVENVAEITGRTHRMEHGKYVRRKLKGVKATRLNEVETENFQQGKKRIAVISAVGGQGISLHSDLTKKNQQRRSFYAFELAWAADAEMQKFGRAHRSFQKTAPIIRSVSVDLAGQQRLINAISSRLAALGAITKGERTTLSGSLFTTNDLTDSYGQAALTQTYNEILRGLYQSEGIGPVVLRRMGILDPQGQISTQNMVNVNRFLNRIMSLTFKMQNRTFEIFYDHYQEIIAKAKETGAFDIGIEDIHAKNIKVVREPTVVYTHEESGAQTELFTLEGEVPIEKITFDQATRFASLGFYRNKISKHIYAAQANDSPLSTDANARVMRNVKGQIHTISLKDFYDKHEKVLGGEAKTWWDEEFAKTPATRAKTYHLLSGVIYPIYDKIMGRAGLRNKRMRRAKLADGSAIVGMDLSATEVVQVKQRFGIGTAFADMTPAAAMALMDDGAQFELDNGWIVKTSQISGDPVLELVAKDPKLEGETIKSYGFRSEIIKFKKRFFELRGMAIPVLRKVLADHKIVRDITSREPPPGVRYGREVEAEYVVRKERYSEARGEEGVFHDVWRIYDKHGNRISRLDFSSEERAESWVKEHYGKVTEREVEEPSEAVSYVYEPAETQAGEKLLVKLRKDAKQTGRKKVGLRNIVDYLNEQLKVMMLVGKTQLKKKYPARYEAGPHIIRTKSGVWQLNFHEAGHALSAMIEVEKPAWLAYISKMLLEMTGPGTMASAETPEEGLAELCRQYVINPAKIPEQLKQAFESLLNELRPDLLAAFRDTHRAYTYHNNRSLMDQAQSLQYDMPKKASSEQAINIFWDILQATIGDSIITHRMMRKIFNQIAEKSWFEKIDVTGIVGVIRSMASKSYRSRLKVARDFRKDIYDSPADIDSARQSLQRVPQEVEAAMGGLKTGPEGINVKATGKGFAVLSGSQLKALTEAGYTLPEVLDPGHGETLNIYPKSFSTIKHDVGLDVWDEFCAYGQFRAALNRWKTKRLQYPGMRSGLGPDKVSAFLAQQEMDHPDWKEQFDNINEYMDQLLLVPMLAGEKTVSEVIRIKKAWTDYWPLPRQIEGRPLTTTGTGAEYSSGIRSAYGSSLPFRSLDEAVRTRTRMAFEAYYTHRFMLSMVNLGKEVSKRKDVPFEAKKLMNRIMLPLGLDIKKIGQMTEHEEQLVIADYLNKQAADLAGVTVKELKSSGQAVKANDIEVTRNHVDLWRQKKPTATHVVSLYEPEAPGSRRYYQITDRQIFNIFARGADVGTFVRHATNIFRPMLQPWKRAKTQNWGFVLWNPFRDSGTAMVLGNEKESYIRGYYLVAAMINRLTKRSKESMLPTEMLSKTLDQLTQDSHRNIIQSFFGMLTEGIAVRGWMNMSWLERIESVPGQAMAIGLKAVDIFNWISGSRYFSQLFEELTREGAYNAARKRGASQEKAQQAYETVSGNFGQRGSNAQVASMISIAGFLNPGIQILGGQFQAATDPDPANRARLFMIKAPLLAASGAVGAALNIMLIKAIWPDEDDQEEIFGQMRDRPDKDRIGYRAIGGQIRLPFDYGVLGALDSYGWNMVEEWLLEDKIPTDTKIQTLLARSRDIPSVPDAINPHIKAGIELHLNHSFFFDDDIVPQWMIDKYKDEPERQAWPNTPKLYKQIGSALKVSPIKIQYAVRNMLDSQMHDLARALDPRPYESKSEWPVMGRLMIRPSEGYGSQPVQTVQDLDSQWSILRSKVRYQEETDGDTGKLKELQQQISKLTISHQVMHEVTALWNDVKEEYRNPVPDYDTIKSRKRLMTEKARKFIKWDIAGRKGKFPAEIISEEYRKSLIKQRKMQLAPRKKGETLEEYKKRRERVMGQKKNAAELLKLL